MFNKTENDLYKDLEETFSKLFPCDDNLEYTDQLKFCQDLVKILNAINIFDYELSSDHDFETKNLVISNPRVDITFFKNWNVNFDTVQECNLNKMYKTYGFNPLISNEERIVTRHDWIDFMLTNIDYVQKYLIYETYLYVFKEISETKIQTLNDFASSEKSYTRFSNCEHLHSSNNNYIDQDLLRKGTAVFLPNDLQIKINFCAKSSWSDADERWRGIEIIFKNQINFPTNKPKLFYCNVI